MSRIGKQIIKIPQGVKVAMDGAVLTVSGPKGTLSRAFRKEVSFKIDPEKVSLSLNKDGKFFRALWGTYAAHVKNMIRGVETPYQKKLILEGVGFKSEVKGKEFHLALGFSHPVVVKIPEGISATAEKNLITVSGLDKELVGAFAASLRALKKAEPYKGKGMRYEDEVVRRKQGKKTT